MVNFVRHEVRRAACALGGTPQHSCHAEAFCSNIVNPVSLLKIE